MVSLRVRSASLASRKRRVARRQVARALVVCMASFVAACQGDRPAQSPPVASAPSSSVGAPGSAAPVAASAPTPVSPPWKLTVKMVYGLCEGDGRSCDGTWTVTDAGELTAVVFPNRSVPGWDKNPRTTNRTLSAADAAKLREVVASDEIATALASGFPCQGPHDDADATWALTITDARGARTKRFEHCIPGPGDVVNAPRTILRLVRGDGR